MAYENSSEPTVDDISAEPSELSENFEPPRTVLKTSRSSWDATDVLGRDYLYRLGKESDNLRISVGAREGMVDHVFVGDFLGKDADIVFKYRQKVTRSFEHLKDLDYYIAPSFLDTVALFLAKNYLADQLDVKIPLILGVWGGKGQGKSFQCELIFKLLGIEPVILSAGELENEWAGEPGKLIRERYREASLIIKSKGKMSCLMINDLDAGIGHFANTQRTVNNQMVFGTLMNLCDNPNRVSVGQDWKASDFVQRVPILVTGNDFSTLWAPLIRDGRMDKFYWQPTRTDIIRIVHKMYDKDGLSECDIASLVDSFPDQPIDFFSALRAKTYDQEVLKWVKANGGPAKVAPLLVQRRKRRVFYTREEEEKERERERAEGRGNEWSPVVTLEPPKITIEALLTAGQQLLCQQQLVNESRLSEEYMKTQRGQGGGLKFS